MNIYINQKKQSDTAEGDIINNHILTLDIGSTNIKSHIYDNSGYLVTSYSEIIKNISQHYGQLEIDPDLLWIQVQRCISNAIKESNISSHQIKCMGITVQRSTFVTWNRYTGKYYHNLLSWQDLRSSTLVNSWNKSFTLTLLRIISKCLYWLTRSQLYLLASMMQFAPEHVSLKLLWALQNIPKLLEDSRKGNVMFGTLDTWCAWKLTSGDTYATDYSMASSTGMYNPFECEWSSFMCKLLSIPMSIFPPVKNTSDDYGKCCLFGAEIPITCLVADQQASMYGLGCVNRGMAKCTLGTGAFIDVNTGNRPYAGISGIYPLIGWCLDGKITYILEGNAGDCGILIEWLKTLGIYDDIKKLGEFAENVNEIGEVYLVSAFSGLQAPINDSNACSVIIGAKRTTNREHIIRAALECISNRIHLLKKKFEQELSIKIKEIRVDGGVSRCDFLLRLISNLNSCVLRKPDLYDSTSYGTCLLAAYRFGDDLRSLHFTDINYNDNELKLLSLRRFSDWKRAVAVTLGWNK